MPKQPPDAPLVEAEDPFDLDQPRPMLLTCFRGLAPTLAGEVEALGLPVRSTHATGLETEGGLDVAMRLCLRSRVALSVQLRLGAFRCRNADDLYARLRARPWERIVPPDGYLSIGSRVDTPSIDNSMYPSLKAKDAIVDRIQATEGRRPDTGPDRHRLVVQLFWKNEQCYVYLNAAGRKLSDRGYRKQPHRAPLRETLAAAIVLAAGYDGAAPLVCPMCGSGTLAIEAALLAQRRAPGLLRDNFGFLHLRGFDRARWDALRREAHAAAEKQPLPPIVLSDRDPDAVEAARRNARTAGVEHLFAFHVCDFAETPLPDAPGTILVNPEYGERLGQKRALEATYARFGDWLKQACPGWRAWIFSGNPDLAKRIGLRPAQRIPFWNARIECRLLEFELYAGSRNP